MKRFYGLVAMGLILGLASGASAHIGDRIYLIFELSEADLADIDLHDADITDWEDVVGDASLVTTDFFQDPTTGYGAQYDPADLDYRIWLGWNGNLGTIWMGTERIDNIYINEYAGGNLGSLWQHDSIEFMLDGDHTGGDYSPSADENWTDEERALNNNRTAQHYLAIGDSPDGRHVGYLGRGTEWVNAPPYADGGGGSTGDGPTTTITEFFVTPFDDLIWNSQEASVPSPLFDGKIIGFNIVVPDFDTAPSEYQAYHILSGQPTTWRYAERFVDGRLVSAVSDAGTAADDESSGEDQPESEEQPTTAVELEGIQRLTTKQEPQETNFQPSWSPDGRHIAFTSDQDGNFEIYVMEADGTNPQRLTNNPSNDFQPSWSPDGRHIAFMSDRDENFEIYVMEADGTNPQRLTNNPSNDFEPSWSPDGRHIAFTSDRDENFEIYVMEADGTNPQRLTNNPADDFRPSWSPDGRHIAFMSDRDENFEIYVMEADGTNPQRLTNNPSNDFGPSWSPDGRHIAFTSDRDENFEIYVMEADGTNPQRLTNNPADDFGPSWSPDGRHIAFASKRDGNGEIYVMESEIYVMESEETEPTVELEGISSSHDSVRENDEQATVITLTVTLDKAAGFGGETITLAIVRPTEGKTAKRGEDFDATLDSTFTIAKGQKTGTTQLTLTPKDNTTADGDKAFGVQATSSSGHAALINIKITDDDSADEPQAWLMPDPAEVEFYADDTAWKTFTVHTNLDSVLVRANPSGSDLAIEVAGGQQVPTTDYCPAEGNDRPTRGRRDGWNLHVKACQVGRTKILLIDYDTDAVVQQYEVNVEANTSTSVTTALNPSYPNPFNSETVLSYTLPTASDIRLEVFALNGQRVAILHEGFQVAGYHTIAMDASDWASGVYLYRLTTPAGRFVQKFTLLR